MMHKIGAALYLLWGLLHVKASIATYQLGMTLAPGIVQGRVYQDAWNLAFFAIAVSVIAVLLNWRNSRSGFWLNFTLATVTDLGFIFHVLIPGHIPMVPGVAGPVLWVLAVIFTAIAIRKSSST